jgi:beta-lactamase regulating signal transducer with metallopeptidase domain
MIGAEMIGALATHVWQSTCFALLVGLLTLAFRTNRAKVRYGLWLSASLKFFVPFSLLTGLGGHLAWAPAVHRIATPAVSFAMEYVPQPSPGPLRFVPSAPGPANWTPIAILGVWLCGFAVIGLIRLKSWLRIRVAVRASTPMEIPAEVEVRCSPGLLEPGVVGFWRPILLLPEGIVGRLTPPQLEAVLAHELCHVRRRDNLFASIHMMVESMFWFHPLVWWIGARLVEERERACDEAVLSLGSEPRIYADAILNVCKLYVESPLACMSGVTGANLKRRIEAIMSNRTGRGLNRAKKFLLASAGVAALVGPVAIGVAIGVGHVPAIRAQSPIPAVPVAQTAPAAPVAPVRAAAQTATAPAAPVGYQDRRLVAMLFDFGTMTPGEQSRARQSAIDFVHNRMMPADTVAVIAAENGRALVFQDFTSDQTVLESVIQKISTGGGNGAAPDAGARLPGVDAAAKILGGLPGKKSLMYYFATGVGQPGAYQETESRKVIEVLQKSNAAAIYLIDVRGPVPHTIAQFSSGGRSMGSQSAPTGVSQEETDRRLAYVNANFGSPASAMGRTYMRYGPPDQVDDRSANAQNPSQIWRYNYLENFRGNVEFEFAPGNRATDVRINWPAPLATYEGTPGGNTTLVEALGRESQNRATPAPTNTLAGLPGRHASFQIYPTGEFQTLSVPLDSLSGRVDILAQIKTRVDPGAAGQTVANFRDNVQASAGILRANFLLQSGTYVCDLIVRERDTGRTYGETIQLQVK